MSFLLNLSTALNIPVRVIQALIDLVSHPRAVVQFLEERRAGQYFSVHTGSLTDEEYDLLRQLVEESRGNGGPIVELGTLLGATTTRMAIWKSPEQKIITVDNYSWTRWGLTPETHYELTSLVLRYLTHTGQVEQYRADKNDWFDKYTYKSPSLVFCDAIHNYEETKKDIDWAYRVGAKCIAGHDYKPEFPGVIQAVKEAGGPSRLKGTLWTLDRNL